MAATVVAISENTLTVRTDAFDGAQNRRGVAQTARGMVMFRNNETTYNNPPVAATSTFGAMAKPVDKSGWAAFAEITGIYQGYPGHLEKAMGAFAGYRWRVYKFALGSAYALYLRMEGDMLMLGISTVEGETIAIHNTDSIRQFLGHGVQTMMSIHAGSHMAIGNTLAGYDLAAAPSAAESARLAKQEAEMYGRVPCPLGRLRYLDCCCDVLGSGNLVLVTDGERSGLLRCDKIIEYCATFDIVAVAIAAGPMRSVVVANNATLALYPLSAVTGNFVGTTVPSQTIDRVDRGAIRMAYYGGYIVTISSTHICVYRLVMSIGASGMTINGIAVHKSAEMETRNIEVCSIAVIGGEIIVADMLLGRIYTLI